MAVIAALLAVFLQTFAIQTHVHAFAATVASTHAAAAGGDTQRAADSGHTSAAHQQTVCVVCQTLASSGRAALPETAAIVANPNAAYEIVALEIRRAPRALTHSWQSRAPPIAV